MAFLQGPSRAACRAAWLCLMWAAFCAVHAGGQPAEIHVYEETTMAGVPVIRLARPSKDEGETGEDPEHPHREWLVKLPGHWDDDKVMAFADRVPEGSRVNFEGHPSEGGLPLLGLSATDVQLEELLEGSAVEYAEEDGATVAVNPPDGEAPPPWRPAQLEAGPEGWTQISPPSWGLDRIDQRDLPLNDSFSWRGAGGAGVHLYIFDTGIRTTHEDFQGRAVPTLDVAGRRGRLRACDPWDAKCAADVNGHGTFCAAIAGGATYGVAKHALLHGVKILSDSGSGRWSWFTTALDWVIVKGQRPAVVSASIWGGGNSVAVQDAITQAVDIGITLVTIAGNLGGEDACRFTPAFVPAAITVASTDMRDHASEFSSVGPCVDIFAPGTDIVSAGVSSDVASAVESGTSMACPHVAGAAALLLSAAPTLTPAEVADALYLRSTKDHVLEAGTSQNRLLYTLAPARLEAVCCFWGKGCGDPRRSCNAPGEWCSSSEERCMGPCRGRFFCASTQSPLTSPGRGR